MIHDFVMTENYIIIPDLPMEFNPIAAIKENKHVYHWNPDGGARYGVLHRSKDDASSIIWFNCSAHFCFHFGNTWDEINDRGETIVILFAVIYENLSMDF